MLATTPLFYAYDWPRRAVNYIIRRQSRDNSATATPHADTEDTLASAAAADDDDDVDDKNADGNAARHKLETTNSPGKVYSRLVAEIVKISSM